MIRLPKTDLGKGLALGLVEATGLSLWVTLLRLGAGTEPFDQLNTTYPSVIALYYGGCAIGGLLVGLAWPLGRSFLGSALLGMIGVLPLYMGVAFMDSGPNQWLTEDNITGSAFLALIVGAPVGATIWLRDNPTRPAWLEALLSPNRRTVALAWAATVVFSGGSYLLVPNWSKDWPPALVIPVFLVLFVLPLGTAIIVTARRWRG